MNRLRARIDSNQPALVKFIRSLGMTYQHTHQLPGCLDGIIGYRGIDQRVEIKDPSKPPSGRRLTDDEKATFELWRGRKPIVIETESDVEDLMKVINREVGNGYELP